MDVETLKFDTTKMVATWWDVVDHYLLAVMFLVSLASVGLQTAQDRLICIPAVNCSNFERNDSVVRSWSEFRNISDICNRSPCYVVLTKMSDRRQYDYIDKECYKRMYWFYSYYSLIFLVEAVILLAISNFWQKCPDSMNALAHCEYMVSEIMLGKPGSEGRDSAQADEEGEQERQRREQERQGREPERQRREQERQRREQERQRREQERQRREQERWRREHGEKVGKRLEAFRKLYGQRITRFNLSSLTWQYRLRGLGGLIATIVALLVNAIYYSLSTGWTQCHIDGDIAFSTEHRFFQCTRSMETFFRVGLILLFVFLTLHLCFVCGSFLWSVTGKRRGPEYNLPQPGPGNVSTYHGDAAFLFHFMDISQYGIFIRFLHKLKSEEERARELLHEVLEQRETSL